MHDEPACPNCRRSDLIRREHVIKGGRAVTDYYCGACEVSWTVAQDERRSAVRVIRGSSSFSLP